MAIKIIRLEEMIQRERSNRATVRLEEEARAVVSRSKEVNSDDVTSSIVREIDLVLDQIDRHRELYRRLCHNITTLECYTNTELMQMEMRTPRYSPYRFPEREKFQRRLLALESDRRRLAVEYERDLRQHFDRLLSLVSRHRQMSF